MTVYKVLIHGSNSMDWQELSGEYEGANANAAIKAALAAGNSDGNPSGTYVAVPARSWDPVKVEAKQAFSFS